MAASRDLRSHVTDLVTCPICLELFNNPKSLPCLHTFCLKCIAGHCRDNEPGDEVACSVCRRKYNIPVSGVTGLVSNFFIAGLVEARKTASDVTVQVYCEVCSPECDQNDSSAVVSTMYCVDCNQKLCERCSLPHSKWKGGRHKVVPLGSNVEAELIQTQGGKCDRHGDENLKLFCFDDMVNICMMCFAEEHQQHKCKNINAVAAECVKQIDADLETVNERADGSRHEISSLDEEMRKFMSGAEDVRGSLVQTGEALKQLIDSQVKERMAELQSLETETCKVIDGLRDTAEMKLLTFQTFIAYCRELKFKGKPSDITRAANDLHTRATELLQNYDVMLEEYSAPTIRFMPISIQELLVAGHNFIGTVKLDTAIGATPTSSSISSATRGENTLEQQLAQSTDIERSLRQQIEVCHSQLTDSDKMWTQKMLELQRQVKLLKEQEITMKASKENARMTIIELLSERKQLRKSERELTVRLANAEKQVKTLQEQLQQLTNRENELQIKILSSEKSVSDLERQCQELHNSKSELGSKLECSVNSLTVLRRKCKQLEETEQNMKATTTKLEKQVEQFRKSKSRANCKLEKYESEMERLNSELELLRKSSSSLNAELETEAELTDGERLLAAHQQIVTTCVHTNLPGTARVCGVTSLDDELYVLREKENEQVEVYSTTATTNYSLERRLSLPGVGYRDVCDMTSCRHYRCLYIADWNSICVYRVELNGKVTKLSVSSRPYRLSVTSQFTVLVTCLNDSKLLELTTEGQQLRVISLQSDIVSPRHAMQLSNSQFVVCHGEDWDSAHRVCIVDTNGHVTQSHGGPPDSATVGQLNEPCHLAVDKDEFIFVLDSDASRLLLLSPTLSFVREIVSRDQLKGKQHQRLFLDVDRRRLYIPESGGVVVVEL